MKMKWISLLVTAIILYVAATRLDWVALGSAVTKMDPVLLASAMGMWVLVVGAKSLKWKTVVSALHGKISILDSARMLLIGLFVGVITPGRMGDFVRAAYLKEQMGTGKGIMAVFVDRLMDVFILLVFAGMGILLLFQATGIHLISNELLALIFVVFLAGMGLSLNRKTARFVWSFLQKIIPQNFSKYVSTYGKQFYDSIPELKKNSRNLVAGFGVGIAAWLLTITFGFFLMRGVGIDLPWAVAFLTIPILALVEIIPLGVAGIGTREVAAVLVLGAYGVAPEIAVLFSLLYFAFGYIPSFILGAIAFNQSPLKGGERLKNFLKNPSTLKE